MTAYDPIAAGSQCWRCPLEGRPAVPSELRSGAKLMVVGMEPGQTEEKEGRPFIGPSGRELERALHAAGFKREDVSIVNARSCRVKKSDPKDYSKRSFECCKPRLEREMRRAPAFLVLGADALAAVYSGEGMKAEEKTEDESEDWDDADDPDEATRGDVAEKVRGEAGLTRLRGFPLRIMGKPALATWHPAHVLRQPIWTEVFRYDVAKAFRHALNKLDWKEPELLYNPTQGELEAALDRLSRAAIVAVDTETDGLEPLQARLRLVQLGSEDFAVAFPFRSIDGGSTYTYEDGTRRAQRCPIPVGRERIRNWLAARTKGLLGHNVNVYDRPLLRRFGMPLPEKVHDTLPAMGVGDSEFSRRLDYASSRYSDMPKHKPGGDHDWSSDEELGIYGMLDTVCNCRVAIPIFARITETGQQAVYENDLELQKVMVGMHEVGMYIDQAERRRHRERLTRNAAEALDRALKAAEKPDLNIRSVEQVRALLYDAWGLPVEFETDSGKASTNRQAIYGLMLKSLPAKAQSFLEALMDNRRANKALGTFVDGRGMEPWLDGRVHPTWGGPVKTGRLTASGPPVQQIPSIRFEVDSLRSMYAAAPGNILVAADAEQLELRLIAVIADIPLHKELIRKKDRGEPGGDVHIVHGGIFLDKPYSAVTKVERELAKTAYYLLAYGGGAETFVENLRQMRDPATGIRRYAKLSLYEGEKIKERLEAKIPELPRWWKACVEDFNRNKFRKSLILGRKRFFKNAAYSDDVERDRNEIINHVVQSSGRDLVAPGLIRFTKECPWGVYGPGMIADGHDSGLVEVKIEYAERTARLLEDCLEAELGGIRFYGKSKLGPNWSKLG